MPGPVSDTYQGPDDWGDLRAYLRGLACTADITGETIPPTLYRAWAQFKELVRLAEFSGDVLEVLETRLEEGPEGPDVYTEALEAARMHGLLEDEPKPWEEGKPIQ